MGATTSNSAGLAASELTLWRGTLCLLDALSLQVMPGSLLLVRGPNGSGKTTLLRVLAGLTRPEQGSVFWHGENIEAQRGEYGRQTAWFGHTYGLKNDLTVRRNLEFFARLNGASLQRIPEVLSALKLDACADLEVRQLSAGQKRRTALARVLMAGATLWLLDEPLTNLDDAGREFFLNCLGRHLAEGGMAIAATHEAIRLDRVEQNTLLLAEQA